MKNPCWTPFTVEGEEFDECPLSMECYYEEPRITGMNGTCPAREEYEKWLFSTFRGRLLLISWQIMYRWKRLKLGLRIAFGRNKDWRRELWWTI